MFFEPRLAHNRATFMRVSRWRWILFGATVVIGVSGMVFAPVRYIEALLAPFFVTFVVLLVAIEVKLFLVFRKDLRERRPIR